MSQLNQAIVALVEHEGKVLVGKKIKTKDHSLSGDWHIPGGKVKIGETYLQAIKREMLEEAGVKVEIKKLIDEIKNSEVTIRWYLCKAKTTNLKPGDDLEKVKFVKKTEVKKVCSKNAISLWPKKVVEYFNTN